MAQLATEREDDDDEEEDNADDECNKLSSCFKNEIDDDFFQDSEWVMRCEREGWWLCDVSCSM